MRSHFPRHHLLDRRLAASALTSLVLLLINIRYKHLAPRFTPRTGDAFMNANPYLVLGVRPFINCCSVRTMHGGSLMLPQVRDAMAEASRQFVNLDELMEAAGQRLAELTGAEWGIVTCGSAAAVALGTAACVASNDPVKMLRLPFTDGMANRVIIPRTQRFAYDQAVRMIGCHLVEIESREGLDRGPAEPTARIVLLGKLAHLGSLRLGQIAAGGKPRANPVDGDPPSG